MSVPLGTPFSLLGYHFKSKLLDLLCREIAALATHSEQARIRARSINIFPLVFQLSAETSTLNCCLKAASLPVSQDSLVELCIIVAQKYAHYKKSIPPSIDQRGFKVFSWNATSLPVKDPTHWKIRKLHNVVRDHIICVQETKLTQTDMRALQMLSRWAGLIAPPLALALAPAQAAQVLVLLTSALPNTRSLFFLLNQLYAPYLSLNAFLLNALIAFQMVPTLPMTMKL